MDRLQLIPESCSKYRGEDGTIMEREYGTTPGGNALGGAWVTGDNGGEKAFKNMLGQNALTLHEAKCAGRLSTVNRKVVRP